MPVGVTTRTLIRTGPASSEGDEHGRYMVAGLAARGPVDKPLLVRSLAEFELLYGARASYSFLYDDLRTFFEEGGLEAYVIRVVGTTPTKGFLVLNDKAGSPVPTLRVEARNPGADSTNLTVSVAAGTTAGTYKLTIKQTNPGTIPASFEVYDNLTTPGDAVLAASASALVKVTNLGSATAAPANQPANVAGSALSAGTDDRATVTSAALAAGLGLIGPEYGTGAMATPGYGTDVSTAATITAVVAGIPGRILLMHAERDQAPADSYGASYVTFRNGSVEPENVTISYPWVIIPDGSATREVPPTGYVAAARARAINAGTPWAHPGGEPSIARFVLGPRTALTRAQLDAVHDGGVVPIVTLGGATQVYGWRSLSLDLEKYPTVGTADFLGWIASECEKLLRTYTFKTIDGQGQLLSRVESTLVGFLDPIRAAGGLFPRGDDAGYTVDVGEALNPISSLAENELAAVVAVRPSPHAALIDLTIIKAGLAAAV